MKIKRIVSTALAAVIIGTAVLSLSSCGSLFAKKVHGTEAAKILLARERLDENTVGQKMSVFSTGDEKDEEKSEGNFFSNLFGQNSILASVGSMRINPVAAIDKNGADVGSTTTKWSKFKQYSDIEDDYTQFIDDIDRMAYETAEIIASIKENVGITEKWIEIGGDRRMLVVGENYEMIISLDHTYGDISVDIRYTTEDAKNVYEMYYFGMEENGDIRKVRNLCIPGERYEYMYMAPNGYNDYFIADKSRGYWEMNRFDFTRNEPFFDTSIVRDGVGYGADISLRASENGLYPDDYFSVDIFLPNEERDLFHIYTGSEKMTVSIYMSNVESGVASIECENTAIRSEEYGGSGIVHLLEGDFEKATVNLSNGEVLKAGDGNGMVAYVGSTVKYSPEYNGDCYIGRLDFEINTVDINEALSALTEYLGSRGIVIASDANTVVEAYRHGELLYENWDITEWYGLPMNSLENMHTAEDMLEKDFETYLAKYEEVKNYESADWFYDVSFGTKFEPIKLLNMGEANYSNGVISISGMKASMDATDLLEKGNVYMLKLGLALLGDNGEISKVNAVGLDSTNALTGAYNGGTLTLDQTGNFRLPTYLSEGEYVVVAYFATADEGIRVTEMLPVAFVNIAEGTLDSDVMDISIARSENNMRVKYEVKLSEWTTCDAFKTEYTYEELERTLQRGVLTKGYPASGAKVQTADGTELDTGGKYGQGTYRLKFLISVDGQLVEAYMYCDFSANK